MIEMLESSCYQVYELNVCLVKARITFAELESL